MGITTSQTIQGITDVFFTWQRSNGTNQVIIVPKPNNVTYNPNTTLVPTRERNKLGVSVLLGQITDETTPEIEITWGIKTLTLLAMQYGYAFGTPATTPVTQIINTAIVTQSTYIASESGFEGFGVALDAVSTGSYESPSAPGVIIPLTQQPFATFNPAIPGSFAIGANFAQKYSDDLVGTVSTAKTVTISVPNFIGSGLSLIDEPFTNFALTYNRITSDRTILQTTYDSVVQKADAVSIDAGQETSITYSIVDTSGGCNVPKVQAIGVAQKRRC